jgi:hypothetical protein
MLQSRLKPTGAAVFITLYVAPRQFRIARPAWAVPEVCFRNNAVFVLISEQAGSEGARHACSFVDDIRGKFVG